ncbi:RHS repeat-associated core domain-containing protein [Nocardiopsis rhodophaea]|uniref:RHS repeat domain-containing protein n=1 Tax=Nocardiopsis rhodophaea TaxID=280238 RepID=UPI0031DF87F2
MSVTPAATDGQTPRVTRIAVRSTALVVAAGLLSAVPASALLYNNRPQVNDENPVPGHAAAQAAIAEDDAVEKAAITTLDQADWPEGETARLEVGEQPQPRTLSVPAQSEAQAVSLQAVPDAEAKNWVSPLARSESSSNAGRGTAADSGPTKERRAPGRPGPDPAAPPSRDAPPAPSASPEHEEAPGKKEEPTGKGAVESSEATPDAEPSEDARPSEPQQLEGAELEVLDREQADAAGVDGLLLKLTRTDGGDDAAPVRVGVNYADFASAFGGDYGSRLELVALDGCDGDSDAPGCRSSVDLGSTNDTEARTLTALAPATGGSGTLLAVSADEESDGGTGDYSATPLQASSQWNVGAQTGSFSWSYPIGTPPVAGGLTPKVALDYSSQSVDGRTASSNNQTSWIGEGFDYNPGYIERRYELCQDADHDVADRCWARQNAMLSLNGTSTELIVDDEGDWHLKEDDGSRIERLTGAKNGDNDGEYWKLTTPDGTQYFFGRNRLPGWKSGDTATKSTWTHPVYGDDSGEPCHASTFAGSWCQQAYKWNLDYVVDVHGSAMAFYYGEETNHYGRNLKSKATPYVRGGYLKRIEYGLKSSDVYGTSPARVDFTVSERCLPTDSFDCAPSKRSEDNADHWPDVPVDRECGADDSCTGNHSPAFFTTKKLDRITTKVHNGDKYVNVDSWHLQHKFPKPGDGTDPALWLDSITHTGHTAEKSETFPSVTFGGTALENRVDSTSDGLAPMYKWRVTSIYTETGGQTDISYSEPECKPGATPKPHANTKRCYPVIWTPEGEEELTDWFHKYVVTQIAEVDLVAQQPDVVTAYEYEGGAAWHYDDPDGITPEERKTWSKFRGYEKVAVRTGHPDETRTETEHLYYRGMDGDKQPSGTRSVTITDSEGGTEADHEVFNGQTREVIVRDGVGGGVVEKTITTPWKKETARRKYSWGTLTAHITKSRTSTEYTALEEGWRTTRVTNSFDDHGYVVRRNDEGSIDDPSDDRCTLTTYNRNTDAWLMATVSRVETLQASCSDADEADRPGAVISDERTHYDGQKYGQKPTRGLATTTERIANVDDGTPKYETVEKTTYDTYGRALTNTDALGNTQKTKYTSSVEGGQATKVTTTNPLGHSRTREFDVRGQVTSETDTNGNRTDLRYDAFGRLTGVWLADRPRANNPRPNMAFEYRVKKDAPAAVVTKTLNARAKYVTKYEIYDGLLRQRQTQSPATDGGRRVTDTFYDSRGNTVIERDAYYNEEDPTSELFVVNNQDEIPRETRTVYDGAGRATDEIHVSRGEEQWRTTTVDLGDRTLVTRPEGGTGTTSITDARGRVTELRKHHGRKPNGEYDATTYTFAKNDEVATITDPGGNTWTYTYDLRGRKIKETDPDTGTTTFKYDAADRMVSSTDARGETLVTVYDQLGRKTELRDDSPQGKLRAKWTYDTLAKGKLASSTRYVDGEPYSTEVLAYDPMNRPRGQKITIPEAEGGLAGTYRYMQYYNPDGSLMGTDMPAVGDLPMESLGYTYDDLGQPETLDGRQGIVSETIHSKTGNLLQREFTRGAVGSEKTWLTRDYAETTDRLSKASLVHRVGSGSLSTQHYDYNDAGNILSIRDEPTAEERLADVQCFDYDYLQRLTDVWTPDATGETACAGAPDADELGGAAPYWHSYTYDETGNRLTETKHSPAGVTERAYTGIAENEGPAHGIVQVDQTGRDGETTSKYEYDEVGNMVRRTSGESDQRLTWDAEGNLASVTEDAGETDYLYDANGERLIRRAGAEWTLYLPGQEVTWTAGEDTVKATRYYEHAGEPVAIRENDGSLHWLFADHNGSTQIALDARSGETVQRRFTAFGDLRSVTESWPGEKGFVGGTIDASTGLTQLGARAYDATIGRFISVDPLLDPTNAQMMNGYTYANNSPVITQDASGLSGCTPADGMCITDRGSVTVYSRNKDKRGHTTSKAIYNLRQKGSARTRPVYTSTTRVNYRTNRVTTSYKWHTTGRSGRTPTAPATAPAPDPYDNSSYKYSQSEKAQRQAESDQQSWGSWWDSSLDGFSNFWDEYGTWISIGATVGCVVISAGACMVAGGLLAGAAYVAEGNRSGWSSASAISEGVYGAASVAGGGLMARGAGAAMRSWKGAWSSPWSRDWSAAGKWRHSRNPPLNPGDTGRGLVTNGISAAPTLGQQQRDLFVN